MNEEGKRRGLIACGVALTAIWIAISVLSTRFVWGEGHAERPILTYLALYGIAFTAYAAAAAIALRARETLPSDLAILLIFTLGTRIPAFLSKPIQESDFYRYQWDGQALRMGINPYAYAPDRIRALESDAPLDPAARADLDRLRDLVRTDSRAAATLDRISYPHLPTLYPPFAQAVFALAQWMFPWKLWGIRLILLLADLAVVGMLWRALKHLGKPELHVLLYAWCPLVVKEGLNSAHVDIAVAAAMAAAAWAMAKRRPVGAGLAVAAAGLIKLGPLILAPLFAVWAWRLGRGAFRRYAGALAAALVAGVFPFLCRRGTSPAGLNAFGSEWVSNASVFSLLHAGLPDSWARIAAGLSILAIAAALALQAARPHSPRDISPGALWTLGTLFCFAPMGNPWYLLWLLPWVVLSPRGCWIYLTGAISLYYLGFYFEYHLPERGAREAFAMARAWEYAPFYTWMLVGVLWKIRLGWGNKAPTAPVITDRPVEKGARA